MDRSYPYSRRLAKRTQRQKRVAALVALGAAGCAILYAWTAPAPLTSVEAAPLALASTNTLAQPAGAQANTSSSAPRRIYPYSIVPGGVSDAKELRRVIREDKIVAAHYAEFDLSKAHEKTVTTPRAVHVSYRKGDKVYWTAKKVMLAEGETLLTDGSHEARARCANQISDTPRLPVEAHGPSAEELDSSVVDNAADGNFENVSAAMPDEGAAGGFLHAPGSGIAGGTLAGANAAESGSLFAAIANVPGAANGAFRSTRSGSGKSPAGQTGGDGAGSGSDGGGSAGGGSGSDGGTGNGAAGGSGTGSTGGSEPAASTPGGSAPSTGSTAPAPVPQTGTPQPATPGAPNTPNTPNIPSTPSTPVGGSDPATPGGTPSTPSRPDQTAPATPDGGNQAGGGANETPSSPSTGGGANPPAGGTPVNPGIPEGGPDSSPVPQPTLDVPQDPTPPRQEPAKPADVPEPGSAWLVGAALALMLVLRRRRG